MSERKNLKPLSEAETRKKFYGIARRFGIEEELRRIYSRYDKLMKTCQSKKEKQEMSIMGNCEIIKLLDINRLGFSIYQTKNGKVDESTEVEILPTDPTFVDKGILGT